MAIDLTGLLAAVTALLGAVLARYLLPWLQARTTQQQREDLLTWAEIAVSAAQQLYHQSGGERRLRHALSVLSEQGFDVDQSQVRAAVEAAVLKLHQGLAGHDGSEQ